MGNPDLLQLTTEESRFINDLRREGVLNDDTITFAARSGYIIGRLLGSLSDDGLKVAIKKSANLASMMSRDGDVTNLRLEAELRGRLEDEAKFRGMILR
jgi:hypothetical protein